MTKNECDIKFVIILYRVLIVYVQHFTSCMIVLCIHKLTDTACSTEKNKDHHNKKSIVKKTLKTGQI